MREITSHKGITPANDAIVVKAMDQPGSGGANHLYMVTGFDTASNEVCPFTERHGAPATHATILFQNGPVPDVGNNGITEQALVAVVMDRLRSFQAGPFACRENALALTKLEEAMMWMGERARERTRRGVQGTLQK